MTSRDAPCRPVLESVHNVMLLAEVTLSQPGVESPLVLALPRLLVWDKSKLCVLIRVMDGGSSVRSDSSHGSARAGSMPQEVAAMQPLHDQTWPSMLL